MPTVKVYDSIEAEISFETQFSPGYGEQSDVDEVLLDTMALDSLHMFGRDWTEKDLRVTFGDMGAEAIKNLAFDMVEEWDDE
jgi:hypothetical protein